MHYNTIISQANDAGDPSITPLAIRKTPRWIEEQGPVPRNPATGDAKVVVMEGV